MEVWNALLRLDESFRTGTRGGSPMKRIFFNLLTLLLLLLSSIQSAGDLTTTAAALRAQKIPYFREVIGMNVDTTARERGAEFRVVILEDVLGAPSL